MTTLATHSLKANVPAIAAHSGWLRVYASAARYAPSSGSIGANVYSGRSSSEYALVDRNSHGESSNRELDCTLGILMHESRRKSSTLDSNLLRGNHRSQPVARDLMGCPHPLQELLADLPQVVFREATPVSKESMVGWVVGMSFISQGSEFDATDIVGYLKEIVVAWLGVAIDCRIPGEAVMNRLMDGKFNNVLPVVVVNLHVVKALEEFKLGGNEFLEISLDSVGEFLHTWKLTLLIAQDMVVIGCAFGKDTEVREIALPGVERHYFVLIMPAHDRCEVEWHSVEFRIREAAYVLLVAFAKILVLVVEYECDHVEGGAVADVSRFVYEDGKPSHQAAPSVIKMPRDTPPAKRQPSLRGKLSLLYHKPKR